MKKNTYKNVYLYLANPKYHDIDMRPENSISLGNNIYAKYAEVKGKDINVFKIADTDDKSEIMKAAIENMQKMLKKECKKELLIYKPQRVSYLKIYDHWTAATHILNPNLFTWGASTLHTMELIVGIPNRGTLLLFPNGDKEYSNDIQKFIADYKNGMEDLLTEKLFYLNEKGIHTENNGASGIRWS